MIKFLKQIFGIKNIYQQYAENYNLSWLESLKAKKLNISIENAKELFELICREEENGLKMATNQLRLDIAYIAGYIDEKGIALNKEKCLRSQT